LATWGFRAGIVDHVYAILYNELMVLDEPTTFEFTPELGARLRELRERAGLSQEGVGRRMGRTGKGCGTIVHRLESGRSRQPTLGLIADFLKACGATFHDLLDELDGYTGKPKRRRRRKTRAEKVAAVQRKANRLAREGKLEELLFRFVMDPELGLSTPEQMVLVERGRERFRELERKHRQAAEAPKREDGSEREQRLEEKVEELFGRLAASGALNRDVAVDAGAVVDGKAKLKPMKTAERRLTEQYRFKVGWRRMYLYYLRLRVRNEVSEEMRKQGVDRAVRYGLLAMEAAQVAHEHGPETAYRKVWMEGRVEKARDPARARQAIEAGYRIYDEQKHSLPKPPEKWRGIASNPGKAWTLPVRGVDRS